MLDGAECARGRRGAYVMDGQGLRGCGGERGTFFDAG